MSQHRPIRFYPHDYLIMGYSLLMVVLLLVFGRPMGRYAGSLAFYGAMIILPPLIARFISEESGRLSTLVRLGYPALLFTFFYRQTGGTMHLLTGDFLDSSLAGFEKSLLGIHPTLYFDTLLPLPLLTELLMLCYFSYYIMIAFLVLYLFFKGEFRSLGRAMAAMCLTFFISYPLFFLYPIEGPRWHFAGMYQHEVTGYLFRSFVKTVQHYGSVRGGCMPSTHVAVGLVTTMMLFRQHRTIGRIFLILTIGMSAGAVWGRYHYVSDVIVGAAIGILATILVWKYYDSWLDRARKNTSNTQTPVNIHAA